MKVKFVYSVLCLILILSCKGLIYDIIVGKPDIREEIKILENVNNNKTIVFFPMVHVGRKEYFENSKPLIDSLRSEGFKFYYENVIVDPILDSLETIIYNKKMRSILGLSPRLDSANKSLPKFYSRKNFVIQDYNVMGLTQSDTKLDMFLNQIVDSIENKYGKLRLSDCDLKTSLNSKYKCKSKNSKFGFIFTNIFRDQYIWEELKKVKADKIVLIYGKMHWYGLYPEFKKNGFEIVRGKI
jgi:hypothetical protein